MLVFLFTQEPLQIALGPHEPVALLKKYVAFQMEQLWSRFFYQWSFIPVLTEAISVWLFSYSHIKLMYEWNIASNHVIPIYTATIPQYRMVIYENVDAIEDDTYFPLDVIFFGSSSGRRNHFLLGMYILILIFLITIITIEFSSDFVRRNNELPEEERMVYKLLSGGWDELIFDEKRDLVVKKAKVMIT